MVKGKSPASSVHSHQAPRYSPMRTGPPPRGAGSALEKLAPPPAPLPWQGLCNRKCDCARTRTPGPAQCGEKEAVPSKAAVNQEQFREPPTGTPLRAEVQCEACLATILEWEDECANCGAKRDGTKDIVIAPRAAGLALPQGASSHAQTPLRPPSL